MPVVRYLVHQIVVVAKKMIKNFGGSTLILPKVLPIVLKMKIISKVHTFIFFSKENAPSSYHECFERSIRGKMAPLIYTANSGLKMEKLV